MQNRLILLIGSVWMGALIVPNPPAFPGDGPAHAYAPWPQFRGPEGLGVSGAKELPLQWDKGSSNIRWKAAVPGTGASSPVVAQNHIFLTTSQEAPAGGVRRRILEAAMMILALVILLSMVPALRGARAQQVAASRSTIERLYRVGDSLVFVSATVAFSCAVALVALGPRYVDAFLVPVRGLLEAVGLTGRLFIWKQGNAAPIWLLTTGIGVLGLAAAAGWLGTAPLRLIGAAATALVAVVLLYFTPVSQGRTIVEWHKRLLFVLPALGVSSWYVLRYLQARAAGALREPPGTRGLLVVVPSIVAGIVMFYFANVVQQTMALERSLLCFDLVSGERLWQRGVFTAPPEAKHRANFYATPTPCTDGALVFAYFGVGLVCMDLAGNLLWSRAFDDYAKNSVYGAATCPVMTEDSVIIVHARERRTTGQSWIESFDKTTGRSRWRAEPDLIHDSYSTPLLFRDGAVVQLLVPTAGHLVSFDASTGEELWRHGIPIQQQAASPGREGNLICLGGGTAGPKVVLAVRLSGQGKDTKREVLWQRSQAVPAVSSPLVYEGMVFTVTDQGVLTCCRAADGVVHWKTRLRTMGNVGDLSGAYFPSLVVGAGRVYALSTEGRTTVLAAESNLQILAENSLETASFATPVLLEGCILIRGEKELTCIGM